METNHYALTSFLKVGYELFAICYLHFKPIQDVTPSSDKADTRVGWKDDNNQVFNVFSSPLQVTTSDE